MFRHFSLAQRGMLALSISLLLAGCVSFGGKAPVSMLLLTADATVAAGASSTGMPGQALVILTPEVPRKLDTNRLPVQINASNVAYLKDSIWTDKPARLFQQLLAETFAAKNGTLVLSDVEAGGKAENYLSGQLVEFGINATEMQAVAIFDAVKIRKGQPLQKRRFEARERIGEIDADQAGEAMNSAANKLAADVAGWMATGS